MKTLFLIFLSIIQFSYSQNNSAKTFYQEGVTALEKQNFKLAEEKLLVSIKLDSLNRDAWFNLAVAQLTLTKNDDACESWNRARMLSDDEAIKYLKDYCKDFRNGNFKSISEVEDLPQYEFKNETYQLIENGDLSSHYKKTIKKELLNSKILDAYQKGKLVIQFNIDSNGIFYGRILRDGGMDNSGLVQKETIKIFKNLVHYIPAKHEGKNVEIWEGWRWTIDFK